MSCSEIVIIEDDLSVRRALERLLRSVGFTVRSFTCAHEVLTAGLGSDVGCLVADIHLGLGIDGFDVVERLRQTGLAAPIIFITAHDDPLARENAHRANAYAYLRKPFEAAAFIDAVRGAAAAHAAARPNSPLVQ